MLDNFSPIILLLLYSLILIMLLIKVSLCQFLILLFISLLLLLLPIIIYWSSLEFFRSWTQSDNNRLPWLKITNFIDRHYYRLMIVSLVWNTQVPYMALLYPLVLSLLSHHKRVVILLISALHVSTKVLFFWDVHLLQTTTSISWWLTLLTLT